jgi:uncharacterized protein (DUF1330 family)
VECGLSGTAGGYGKVAGVRRCGVRRRALRSGWRVGALCHSRSVGWWTTAGLFSCRSSCFEPGTVASGLLVARWPDRTAALASAEKYLLPLLPKHLGAGREPTIFVVDGLPVEGLPSLLDIPTVASVLPVTSPFGSVLMIIRGEAFDSSRMDIYRDIILPMMKLHGSYYEAFALSPGQVTTSAGRWDEQVFAISRWPSRKDAENFWFSAGYQTGAIPNRIGAGRFSVHVVEGL